MVRRILDALLFYGLQLVLIAAGVFVGVFICSILADLIIPMVAPHGTDITDQIVWGYIICAVGALCGLFLGFAWARLFVRHLHLRRRRKLGLCVKCGYRLEGLTEPRCPECATEFDEQVIGRDGRCAARR